MALLLLQPWAVLEAYESEEGIAVLENAKEEETAQVQNSELEISEEGAIQEEATTAGAEEKESQNVDNATVASESQDETSDDETSTGSGELPEGRYIPHYKRRFCKDIC